MGVLNLLSGKKKKSVLTSKLSTKLQTPPQPLQTTRDETIQHTDVNAQLTIYEFRKTMGTHNYYSD